MAGDEQDSEQFINIRNQASLSLAGNVVDAAISFFGLVLFANVLGADGLGKFYVLLAVVKVCLFPIAGIGQSVMKRGSERGLDSAVVLGGGFIYGTAYAVLAGVVVVIVFFIDSTILQYSPKLVAGAFAVFASRILYMLLLDAYRSRGKTGFATLTDNTHGITETGAQVALLLAGFGVMGLLAGTALTTIAVSAALLAFSKVQVARPSLETLQSIAKFGRWSVLTSGLGTIYDRLPVLVLGFVLGNTVAGYYTSAMRLLMLGSYVGGAIAPALMVRTSASSPENSTNSNLSDLSLSIQYASVLAIPMMFGSLAIPNALMVTIFGPTFTGTGLVLIGLSIYHVVNTYNTVSFAFFDGIDRPDFAMKSTVVVLAIRIVAIIGFLPGLGLMGVIIAVVLSHAAELVTIALFLQSEYNRIIIPTRVSYQFASAILMWIVVEFVTRIRHVTGWASLLVVVSVGAMVYAAVLLLLDSYLRHATLDVVRDVPQTLVNR